MIEESYGDVRLLRFERLGGEAAIAHAVTTRPANMAPHRGLGRSEAVSWRHRVCEILGVAFDALTAPEQVHGADVLRIAESDVGCGRDGRASAVRFVDGLVTDRQGVTMVILSADCPVVCAYDPDGPAIGAVHASWRGTVAGAAENLVRQMVAEFGSEPGRLLTAIAPSAGPCCYQVGDHVRRVARTRLQDADACFIERDGRVFFDMWTANRLQLVASGVRAENIEVGGVCSICDERLWSHRRDGQDAGRFGLFLGIR